MDIFPSSWVPGIGVDVQATVSFCSERKSVKKSELCRVEMGSRPLDYLARIGIHGAPCSLRHRLVMVAEHSNRAALHRRPDDVHHEARVCSVTDEIPEEGILLSAPTPGVVEARRQGFEVRVDVSQQRRQHEKTRISMSRRILSWPDFQYAVFRWLITRECGLLGKCRPLRPTSPFQTRSSSERCTANRVAHCRVVHPRKPKNVPGYVTVEMAELHRLIFRFAFNPGNHVPTPT